MRFSLNGIGNLGAEDEGYIPATIAVLPPASGPVPIGSDSYISHQDLERTCQPWQQYNYCLPSSSAPGEATTLECKGGCQTTPLSLLRFPGFVTGKALKKVFTSQDEGQLEMVGHIAMALFLIGGTVYLFNRHK